jgi:toxin-antitoxin system PIN domain toxin
MKAYLLDVSVLVALAWPQHESHEKAQHWFAHNATKGWATCPMVEAGFVRVVSNPAFSNSAVSPRDATRALAISVQQPIHRFWADTISMIDALAPYQGRLAGHQQVTDFYLLALAIHHGGKLVTLDKRLQGAFPERSRERDHLEII